MIKTEICLKKNDNPLVNYAHIHHVQGKIEPTMKYDTNYYQLGMTQNANTCSLIIELLVQNSMKCY